MVRSTLLRLAFPTTLGQIDDRTLAVGRPAERSYTPTGSMTHINTPYYGGEVPSNLLCILSIILLSQSIDLTIEGAYFAVLPDVLKLIGGAPRASISVSPSPVRPPMNRIPYQYHWWNYPRTRTAHDFTNKDGAKRNLKILYKLCRFYFIILLEVSPPYI